MGIAKIEDVVENVIQSDQVGSLFKLLNKKIYTISWHQNVDMSTTDLNPINHTSSTTINSKFVKTVPQPYMPSISFILLSWLMNQLT